MKFYRLKYNLPTFEKGWLFCLDEKGNLVCYEDGINRRMIRAYSASTLKNFPNILRDWFDEVPEPVRDKDTKKLFAEYLKEHKSERFFQAIRNFSRIYLDSRINFVSVSSVPPEGGLDTFYWNCDKMMEDYDEN